MEAGKHVKFKLHDHDTQWRQGLLVRYDRFLGIGEIVVDDILFYAPARLITVLS